MNSDLEREVIELIEKRGQFPVSRKKDILACRYLDLGLVDSIELIGFIIEIEDRFNISFEAEETESDEFRYTAGLIGMIQRKTSNM
jgi:acyl carrier protein